MFSLKKKLATNCALDDDSDYERGYLSQCDDDIDVDEEIDSMDCVLQDLKSNPYLEEFNNQHFGYQEPNKSNKVGSLSFSQENLLKTKSDNLHSVSETVSIPTLSSRVPSMFKQDSPLVDEVGMVGKRNFTSLEADMGADMENDMENDRQADIKTKITMPICQSTKNQNFTSHQPSELRISTMTAVCNINVVIRLDDIYQHMTFHDDESQEDGYPYIKTCQFASEPLKGYTSVSKSKRAKSKVKVKNCFQNQATLIIALSTTREINLKIFRNGKIQMTGLKSEEEGYLAVNTLIKKIKDIYREEKSIIISGENELMISDFTIVLINSDFRAGFRIKRERLYELLFKSGMYVSYEPDIYPGVNAKFYWNCKNPKLDGICRCSNPCNGKGNGDGDGECKKVTIATFQSGNVIITGARRNVQTQDAYQYINKMFSKHMDIIVRRASPDEEAELPQKNNTNPKKPIKMDQIKNMELREKLKMIVL